jgi:serine/threonine protein kinase
MLPVADYNLLQFLRRESISRIDRTRLTKWFGCLISALTFAHSQQIKHEDIKPTNILIKDHQPYLADFGCAQDFSDLPGSTSTDILAFGTPAYWSPEPPPRGRGADVFSLGCVFSEMLSVRQGHTLDEYQQFRYQQNRDNPYAFREGLPKVQEWLNKIRPSDDSVADLLIDQTLGMLETALDSRPLARAVKRALRVEDEHVFCSTCV